MNEAREKVSNKAKPVPPCESGIMNAKGEYLNIVFKPAWASSSSSEEDTVELAPKSYHEQCLEELEEERLAEE